MNRDTSQSVSLCSYWFGLLVCAVILAGYIAAVEILNTETAQRGSAPPWYAWVRYPPTRTLGQAVFLVPPMIVYAIWVGVVRWMMAARRADWVIFLLSFLFVLLINSTVAMMDGSVRAIWRPFDWHGLEYFYDVPKVHGVAAFLRDYAANLNSFGLHTRTHPPGAVLVLYFVAKFFGPGIRTAAWAAVVITATGAIPSYLLARRIAGEHAAVIAMALYAVTPGLVIFGATSMDGVFLPFIVWLVYFLHRAVRDHSMLFALAGGIMLFVCFMLTYATVCVAGLMLLIALSKSPRKSLPVLALGGVLLILCFLILYFTTGCDILACLRASRASDHYAMRTRTLHFWRYVDISFDNIAAFLVGVGLPALVLWARPLKQKTDGFQRALLGTLLFFTFARLYTHETERVWMFLYPLALIAPAQWIAGRGSNLEKRRVLDWAMGLLFLQTWLTQLLVYTMW